MRDEGPSPDDLKRFGSEEGYCPECGDRIWDQAEQCPACGAYIGGSVARHEPVVAGFYKRWVLFIIIITLIAFLMVVLF